MEAGLLPYGKSLSEFWKETGGGEREVERAPGAHKIATQRQMQTNTWTKGSAWLDSARPVLARPYDSTACGNSTERRLRGRGGDPARHLFTAQLNCTEHSDLSDLGGGPFLEREGFRLLLLLCFFAWQSRSGSEEEPRIFCSSGVFRNPPWAQGCRDMPHHGAVLEALGPKNGARHILTISAQSATAHALCTHALCTLSRSAQQLLFRP